VNGDYTGTYQLYSRIIDLEPDKATNFVNRYKLLKRVVGRLESGAYIMKSWSLGDYERMMIHDLTEVISLDSLRERGTYGRDNNAKEDKTGVEYVTARSKILMGQGNCTHAMQDVAFLTSLPTPVTNTPPETYAATTAALTRCMELSNRLESLLGVPRHDENIASRIADTVTELMEAIGATPEALIKTRATACLKAPGKSDYLYTAVSDLGSLIKTSPSDSELYHLRGLAYLHLGELAVSLAHFKSALKNDPEHKECKAGHKFVKSVTKKMDRADEADAKRDYDKALENTRELRALVDGHGEKLTGVVYVDLVLTRLARALTKAKLYDEAEVVGKEAIQLHASEESYIVLSDALIAAEKFDEAVHTLNNAQQKYPESERLKEAKNKAAVALKQSKEKDYYKILDIERTANKAEIKKGYKAQAMKWHPDKNAGNEEEAEKKFQDIAEAYEVLSDDDLKARYDRGEDVMDNNGGGGRGGGGGPFGHGGGFPRQHFQQRGGGGGGGGRGQQFHFNFG
jgi:DnaJ family protein C protein 3